MSSIVKHSNEEQASLAFTKQSAVFDELYASNTIIRYKRNRVRETVLKYLPGDANILELNAGTGDDAIFFAHKGYRVHATDISEGMQAILEQKIHLHHLSHSITQEKCSYTALNTLVDKGPYDCIFSNFAGLNCTRELDKVLASFDKLLKPGGLVVLVMLPPFCLWETLLLFRGKFKTATRRFFTRNGSKANVEGTSFTCWYYAPGYVTGNLKNKFNTLSIEGLCTLVPPSYLENFAEKYPRLYSFLCRAEHRLKNKWPWKNIGDYYIISLRKK
jgi:ubiquinone/menaquinone biosynthesis C-methylase UbiE